MTDNIPNEDIYDDTYSSLLKIDMPIGKMKFFINSIIIFLISIVGIVLYYVFYFLTISSQAVLILIGLFFIFFGLPLIYLNFVNYTKRIWDLTGTKKHAVIITIILFFTSFIFMFIFQIAILLIYLFLIFYPGKLINKNDKTTNV